MAKYLAFLATVLFAAVGIGQNASLQKLKTLTGVTPIAKIGNREFISEDSAPAVSDCLVLTVTGNHKFILVKIKRDGERIQAEALDAKNWLVSKPGVYLFDVTLYDAELGIWNDEIEAVLTPGPKPPEPKPPEPKPPVPSPDGPFDGLASRVAKLAANLTAEDRAKWAGALSLVVSKMKSFEIKRVEDAKAFLAAQKIACSEIEVCNQLNKLLSEDAAKRQLGWEQAIDWYSQILKGVQ